jgi:F0F1-type ATP synthase alpha subunit
MTSTVVEMISRLASIAPYTGATIAEYFMYQGTATCTVYDDLTKHALGSGSMTA